VSIGLDPDGDGSYLEGTESETDTTDDSTWWSDISGIPDVLTNLGDGAKKLLRDPRTYIIGVIIEWLVGGILDFVETTLAVILEGFALVAGVPASIGGAFGAAGGLIQTSVFGVFGTFTEMSVGLVQGLGLTATIGTFTEMSVGLVQGLGWTAPIVAAVVFFLLLETTEEFGPVVMTVVARLLGAIPVVGSILEAGLTLLLRLGAVLGGDDS
jgi:hypothetical protein